MRDVMPASLVPLSPRLVLLTLLGTTALLCAIWGFALVQVQNERRNAIAAEIKKNSDLAQVHQTRASTAFALLDQTLLFLRADYINYGVQKSLNEQLRAAKVQLHYVSNVALMGPTGLSLSNTAGPEVVSYADRDYFQAHASDPTDRLFIGKPVLGRITGDWVIPLSRRISRADGSFGGVVRMSVKADFFSEDYARFSMGPKGSQALIGLDGISRARRNGDKISFGEDVRSSQLFKEIPKSAHGSYEAVAASDGVRRVISYRSLESYPLVAIVGSSLDDVLAATRARERVYWVGAAAATAGTLLFVWIFLSNKARGSRNRARAAESERELRRLTQMLESTGEMAQVGGWEVNLQTMKLTWTREVFRIAGIEPPHAPPLKECINLFAPQARPTIAAAVQAAIDTGTPYDLELPIVCPNGPSKWVRTQGSGEMLNGKVVRIFGSVQDISKQVQGREERRTLADRLALATRAGGIGIWDWDLGADRQIWDDTMYALYGIRADQFNGAMDFWRSLLHPDDLVRVDAETQAALDGIQEYNAEFRVCWPNGEVRNIRAIATVKRDSGGAPLRMVGTNWDITPQKNYEKTLQVSLKEKEALLKEVHHRVKNNLQVITSLLRMEARRSAAPAAIDVLKDMQSRIYAMARLHESLYRSGTLASIDLGAYLSQIARQSFETHLKDGNKVQLKLNMGSVDADMDQSMTCGLLVNELVSNSLKHGFVDGRSGQVLVELQPAGAEVDQGDAASWCLRVSDTGVGLPPDFEQTKLSSLGMQLVSDLSKQLGGTLRISSPLQAEAGVEFSVVFEVLKPVALVMPE